MIFWNIKPVSPSSNFPLSPPQFKWAWQIQSLGRSVCRGESRFYGKYKISQERFVGKGASHREEYFSWSIEKFPLDWGKTEGPECRGPVLTSPQHHESLGGGTEAAMGREQRPREQGRQCFAGYLCKLRTKRFSSSPWLFSENFTHIYAKKRGSTWRDQAKSTNRTEWGLKFGN